MTKTEPLERAQGNLEAAEAALGKAQAALGAEQKRVADAQADLAALDARILALDPHDVKAMIKADSERVGMRVALEVLERARLPRAQGAVEEARAAAEAARAEHEHAEAATRLAEAWAERTRIEAALVELVERVRGEAVALLEAHQEVFQAGWRAANELGETWSSSRWPDPNASGLFGWLERAATPPPTPVESPNERAMREADRRNDERFLARLREDLVREQPPAAPVQGESGLTERQLAGMRQP